MKFQGKNSNAFNFIYEKYEFRYNLVTNFIEYKKRDKKKKWKKYDDRKRKSILLELIQQHRECPTDKVDIFIESEDCSYDYNPFDDYFENLKKWDKKTDYVSQIAATVKTDNDKHFAKTLERFLVGTLDCLLNPDNVNDVCLVFQSGQGIGKTRWMRRLLPNKFRKEYLYEGNIDTKNKDHVMYLSQYWFIHLDELETLRQNDINAIKSYITRQRISVRRAFGRYKTNYVRRASFLGSVNDDKFLSDMTGNRRWLVFKTKAIDYMHDVDAEKLWAQVYYLYKKGYRHWFNLDEIKVINRQNEKFRSVSLEEELLLRYFDFNKKTKSGEYLSSSEIVQKTLANVPNFTSKVRNNIMGRALSKHSKSKIIKGGVTKYFVDYKGVETSTYSPSVGNNKNSKDIEEGDDVPF